MKIEEKKEKFWEDEEDVERRKIWESCRLVPEDSLRKSIWGKKKNQLRWGKRKEGELKILGERVNHFSVSENGELSIRESNEEQ